MSFALAVRVSSSLPAWWLVISCVLVVLAIPAMDWIARSAARKRIALALCFIVVAVSAVAIGQVQCPECFDGCCPDLVPYGICWPIGWWPC